MKYRILICGQGQLAKGDGVAAQFESDAPFGTISIGDLINRSTWGKGELPAVKEEKWSLLRVVGVEHLLGEGNVAGKNVFLHTTTIYTEVAEDTVATRYTKPGAA
jgi:hypothetical protein